MRIITVYQFYFFCISLGAKYLLKNYAVPDRKITVNDDHVLRSLGSWEEDDTLTWDSSRWCQARTTYQLVEKPNLKKKKNNNNNDNDRPYMRHRTSLHRTNKADQLTTFPAKNDFYLRCLPGGADRGSNNILKHSIEPHS